MVARSLSWKDDRKSDRGKFYVEASPGTFGGVRADGFVGCFTVCGPHARHLENQPRYGKYRDFRCKENHL